MKPKYLIIGGASIIALTLMSFAQKGTALAKQLFEKLNFKISGVSKIRIADSKLKFNANLSLENPTAQEFSASTVGLIEPKAFRVYRGNSLITFGTLSNFNQINLTAGGTYVFSNIPVEIPLLSAGSQLIDIITQGRGYSYLLEGIANIQDVDFMSAIQTLRYEIDIEAFGIIYTFKN